MTKKKELKDFTYEELEKEADEVLTKLSNSELGLDESTKLYTYGKEIAKEMDLRLSTLEKQVNDNIEEN